MRGAAGWLAALPLLLLPGCWLWWWAAGHHPGLEIGRSAAVLLAAGAAGAAWTAWRAPRAAMPPAVLPLHLALAWQAASLAWSPVPELGLNRLGLRGAGLATAVALALACAAAPGRAVVGAALAGLGILVLTAATQGGWGEALAIGREAPFGLVNFAIGAALPLAMLGLARCLHCWSTPWAVHALATAAAAALLGLGWLGGDPSKAAWLGLAAGGGAALLLRLTRPGLHLTVLALGAALVLAGWLAVVAGAEDPERLGHGVVQRVHLAVAGAQALAGPAAVVGHAPAAALAVLPEQPAFAAAWLAVPSWAEHVHSEPLEVLLEGGAVLAALLAWALYLTVAPLWRRRAEPECAALLAAWATAAVLALVDVHLSQPGGVLCLAVLAAASWAAAGPGPAGARTLPGRPVAITGLAAAILLAALGWRELAGLGGGPVSIARRAEAALAARDPAERLAALDRLRARLGPLDDLDLQRARALGNLGRHAEAARALADHLRRLPVDARALELARRLRLAGLATPELAAAEAQARSRAAALLADVAENPVNRDVRTALGRALAH